MEWYWFILLALIAFLYASVGHGGASGYLALMAIIGVETCFMRSTSLTLNLFVSIVAFVNYYRKGFFRLKLLLPFVLASMPMAYLGARIMVDPKIYKIILGIFLIIATARMLFHPKERKEWIPFSVIVAVIIGAILGLFSGMIGIGGGIILTPILILLGWATLKEAAAVSALFIFLNSTTGLVGVIHSGFQLVPGFYLWVIIGVVAGILGSWVGSTKISTNGLRYVLAGVLVFAAFKLFVY
jgi:uncharacterized protein